MGAPDLRRAAGLLTAWTPGLEVLTLGERICHPLEDGVPVLSSFPMSPGKIASALRSQLTFSLCTA